MEFECKWFIFTLYTFCDDKNTQIKKLFYGFRTEMNLPFIAENLTFGAQSFLYFGVMGAANWWKLLQLTFQWHEVGGRD